jgi:ATP-dependent Clp protease ATP-binding subunit ClpA
MLYLNVLQVLKHAQVEGQVDIRSVVEELCRGSNILHDEIVSVVVDVVSLVSDMQSWAAAHKIDIMGTQEVMTYLLDKYGVSFTIPVTAAPRTITVLDYMCTNLVEQGRLGNLDPVIARDKVIDQCISILMRRTKSNPILVGLAGSGN